MSMLVMEWYTLQVEPIETIKGTLAVIGSDSHFGA